MNKPLSIILVLIALFKNCLNPKNEGPNLSSVPNVPIRPLAEILALIDFEDQRYRVELDSISNKSHVDTVKIMELGKKMRITDSINQLKICAMLDTAGWPDTKLIGDGGSNTIWAVIQHADLATQEKYFPLMKRAVAAGKLNIKYLCYTADRILMFKGLKQIYGTQFSQDIGGEPVLLPLKDPYNIDSLRAAVNMQPLSTHVKQNFSINWDLHKYYEDLPKADSILSAIRIQYLAKKQRSR